MKVQVASTPEHRADALRVRFEVFVGEQGVSPEGERDDLDDHPQTVHVVAYDDDHTAIGAGRLLAPHTDTAHGPATGHGTMNPANPHIGRVAVVAPWRGRGVGVALMAAMERAALQRFATPSGVSVELSAQEHAIAFYQRLGYEVYGERYLDEGIWHRDAIKHLRDG